MESASASTAEATSAGPTRPIERATPTSLTHAHILAALATALPVAAEGGPVRVLDVGCGNGLLLSYLGRELPRHLHQDVELFGFDVADSGHVVDGFPATAIRELSATLPGEPWGDRVVAVAVDDPWPFPDNSFDAVCSNQVLEHVFDLDHFLLEMGRTLKPGGIGVHVFPLKRVFWECHTRMPFVHRVASRDARVRTIDLLSRLPLGRYSSYRDRLDRPAYAAMSADLLQFACRHRSFGEIALAAKRARLSASHRYTDGYYLQKLAALRRRPLASRYGSPSLLREAVAFATLPYIASATVVIEKPVDYEPWHLEA